MGRETTKLQKETSRRVHRRAPIVQRAGATFHCQTLILPPRRSNAAASIRSRQHGALEFGEHDPSQIVEPLNTALAVAQPDPETPSVWVAVPRTELRSCPTKAPTNPHGRRPIAQAALSPCDWSEKRCVSTDCPSYLPLSAEPVMCRLPKKGTHEHHINVR